MTQTIDTFVANFDFLSNFYMAPIVRGSMRFPSNEHFFQSQKLMSLKDQLIVITQSTPGMAKRKAHTMDWRSDWADIKDRIMMQGLMMKFNQHLDLRTRLLATEDAQIIERNKWHDNYWGECLCQDCQENRQAKNKLGVMLMAIREDLK